MKNKKLIIILTILIVCLILAVPFLHKAYSGGGNEDTTKTIAIKGFQYGKGFDYLQDAECILKNVKISSFNSSENINGKSVPVQRAQIECNVTIKPAHGKEISFYFKGNGPSYETVSKRLPFHPTIQKPLPDLKSLFMGFCYDNNKHPIPGYTFYLTSDLSSAAFISGAGSRTYFYTQLALKKWVIVCPMVSDNPNIKAFFFENGVNPNSFREAALKGSIFDELKNKSNGKEPSLKDIYNFVTKEINNSP